MKKPTRLKHVKLGPHTIEVYTIGCLSEATNMAKVTLRLWERQHLLPRPILKLPGSIRYYTALEITTYAALIERHYTSGRDLVLLRSMLASAGIQCRERLKEIVKAEVCPVNISSLHLSPRPKWNHVYHQKKPEATS